MKRKKQWLLTLSLALVFVTALLFYINDQRQYTTFQEVLAEELEGHEIIKVTFTDERTLPGKEITLEGEEALRTLFDSLTFQTALKMALKSEDLQLPTTNYTIEIYTDKPLPDSNQSVIVYGENDLRINDRYFTLPDGLNELVRLHAEQF